MRVWCGGSGEASCREEQSGCCAGVGLGEVLLWERVGGGTLGSSPTRASSLPARRTGRGMGAETSGEVGRNPLALLLLSGFPRKSNSVFPSLRPGGGARRRDRRDRCPLPPR